MGASSSAPSAAPNSATHAAAVCAGNSLVAFKDSQSILARSAVSESMVPTKCSALDTTISDALSTDVGSDSDEGEDLTDTCDDDSDCYSDDSREALSEDEGSSSWESWSPRFIRRHNDVASQILCDSLDFTENSIASLIQADSLDGCSPNCGLVLKPGSSSDADSSEEFTYPCNPLTRNVHGGTFASFASTSFVFFVRAVLATRCFFRASSTF